MNFDPQAENVDPLELLGQGFLSGPSQWDPPAVEEIARQIPGIEIVALAGRGGMGAVYRAKQTRLDRWVAVKVLPADAAPDAIAQGRFHREAQTLAALDHSGIVRVLDIGELPNGLLYMVMEWADGGDLREKLADGPLPPAWVWERTAEIGEALAKAHEAGIIHRDLKPANVLLTSDDHVKLADFGLARSWASRDMTHLTLTGTAMGTPEYMAPEQKELHASISPATDVFSLGVLVYEMLTCRRPRGAFRPASELANIPSAVDRVLRRALAADPNDRFQTAEAFLAALDRAVHSRQRQRRLVLALSAGALSLFLIGGVAWFNGKIPFLPTANPETATSASAAPSKPLSTSLPLSSQASSDEGGGQWLNALESVEPEMHTVDGWWNWEDTDLVSGEDRCILRLPIDPGYLLSQEGGYDVRSTFTRIGGRYAVVFFLPTHSGPCTFSLDAWDNHLAGIQCIDGQDIRTHGWTFFAELTNGEQQEILIEVRRDRITVFWNGQEMKTWSIKDRRLSIANILKSRKPALPGIGSWASPTRFHSVEIRPRPLATSE